MKGTPNRNNPSIYIHDDLLIIKTSDNNPHSIMCTVFIDKKIKD